MNATPRPTTLVIANIAWDFVWQRHQTLASLFARDSDVVFCEIPGVRRLGLRDAARVWARLRTLREKSAKADSSPVRVVRPFVVPATNSFFHALNRRLIRRFLAKESALTAGVDTILNYSAARSALELIARVPHRRLVYDCTDDLLAVRGVPTCLAGDERLLMQRADLTLVPSRRLEELKRPHARRLRRLPHGALVERFLLPPKTRAADERVTVLYYGHLHAQHLDFAAIETLAKVRPAWRLVLVGPVKTPYAFPANVELPGQMAHERLREQIEKADVLLLPYALNDYTRSVMPAKTYECLATGRPIVAAPLPELTVDFSTHMRFASDGAGFVREIEGALAQDTNEKRAQRVALVQANTWETRYAQLRVWLAEGGA